MDGFQLSKTTKGKIPFRFSKRTLAKLKNYTLGSGYSLSLVFVGDKFSKTINKKYRNKDKVANVLAFNISEDCGEIFINVRQASREAKNFERSPQNHIAYIFIHGMLHLDGMDHGRKMDNKEDVVFRKFFGT